MKMTVNSMKCISWSRLAIFTAAMTVLSSCGGGQSGMKLGDDEFTVVAVQSTASQQSTSYPATIKGVQDIEVRPQVSGFIVKLCVDEGATVKKGQALFQIDPTQYAAAERQAKAAVEMAKSNVNTLSLNEQQKKNLYDKKIISDFEYQSAVDQLLSAKASLAQAEAQETNARNNLSYTEVKSPSDGVVGALPYRVGALVSANIPQPLTTVSDNSNMYVYFSMNENQLLSLTRQYGSMDDALKNMPEVELRLNDNSIYEHKGKIESISGVIDRQTGTVTVRSVFPNEARLLHSGASGAVIIPSTYENCIVIPQEATIRLQDKTMVYKVVDGKAVSSLITVAELNDGREYVVLDGLKAGEEIVSQGAGLVREGTQVK